jgi:cbb3-type cytochrome oxidase subunit 3
VNPDLSQLHDIHLPAPVSWWPLAIGWWLLLLLIIILVALGYWFYRRHQRQQWRREALAELRQLQQQQLAAKALVVELSKLLRRVAITRFPRAEVASLTGDKWLSFLDQQMKQPGFVEQGRVLITAPYSASVDVDLGELTALCERWIAGVAR